MSITITGGYSGDSTGGVHGSTGINSPTPEQAQNFADGIKGQNKSDLLDMLKNGNLKGWEKDAVINELAAQAKKEKQDAQAANGTGGSGGAGGADGSGDDSDEIKKLLKKLMSGHISEDDKSKLAGLLNTSTSELDKLAKGGEGSGGNSDIQGG